VAVNVASSLPHTCVLLAVTVGADGAVPPLVMVMVFELPLVPHVVLQVAL
jgi:hypothetical protein